MNNKATILFKFATRSRPDKFLEGMRNISDRVGDKENYKILITADEDDPTMNNEEIRKSIEPYIGSGKASIIFGKSGSKIAAINRDMETERDWDILVNFSDDMEFVEDGFDDTIRSHFEEHFPDFDGNMHYNDGYRGESISTLSIIGKKYFDAALKGNIYHPEYISLYCDNEYTEVAKRLNKIKYYDIALFRHNHPVNTKVPMDEQYRHTQSFLAVDRETYLRRRALNFEIG